MRVVVDTGMTYETDIADIKEGDTVIVPAPYWMTWATEHSVSVVRLKSDYKGECRSILRRVVSQ